MRTSLPGVFAALVLAAVIAEAAEPLSYSRDIRPILSDNCFSCHGPDEAARQADLRLDQQQQAFRDRGGYAAIVPFDPEASEAFARMTAEDPDLRMPPAASGRQLTEEQLVRIRGWIEQGGRYEAHWAFVPPRRPPPPATPRSDWAKNEIDAFVLAAMQSRGLTPARPAEPVVLLRRVYLDLIGLPPLDQEAAEFLADVEARGIDTAYAAVVDGLLDSPHYGERWARLWLDLARYADTNGYEKDRPREIWAYRDWVIDALNADMPFAEFTIAQIAGDMLPDATLADRIATGFHRNTMLNEEGGIDPLEYRFHALTDRVATTGTAWLGLTLGCAQCHSHKYDPISHREYYRLMAYLNNADEPELDLPDAAKDAEYERNLEEAARRLQQLPKQWPGDPPQPGGAEADDGGPGGSPPIEQRFAEWLAETRQQVLGWQVLRAVQATSNLPLLNLQPDGSIFASGDTTKNDTYRLKFRPPRSRITAIRLEALPDSRLPAHGPGMTYYEGTKGDFFLGEFQLTADGQPVAIAGATHSYAKNRFGNHAVSASLTLDGDPQTGWSVHGRQGQRHVAVYALERPLEANESLELTLRFGRHFSSSLGRFRLSATNRPQAPTAADLPEEIEACLAVTPARRSAEQQRRLWEQFLLTAPELSEASAAIRRLRQPPEYPTTLVFEERSEENPRQTFVHHRGEYLQPAEQVVPGVPECLHPFPDGQPQNRLGFARWLVAGGNPLTARVFVNRQWAALFGQGIVRTVDDFGHQGRPPSHPELLDWLAVEFQESGGSRKHLHRLIVTSATYRQSSRVSPEKLAADSENRWLARAPRPRLPAETIRDAVLRAGGLLSPKRGGPGVRPPQPAGVTEVAYGKPTWEASSGPDRYRRSIYTFQKRTAPFALYATFDAPSGEACTARREVSNTPLQALTLMNDVVFAEAARALGQRCVESAEDDSGRVHFVFRRVLTRPPEPGEAAEIAEFAARQRQRFSEHPEAVEQIAGDAGGGSAETAVWTAVARALFCLDEAITRN